MRGLKAAHFKYEKLVSTLALLGLVSEKRPNPAHHAQALSLGWKVRRAPERDGVQRLAGVVQHHGQLVRQLALFAVLERALLYHHLEGARVKFLVQVLRESRSELLQLNGWLP